MNVSVSDQITDSIKFLRLNVYNSKDFMNTFSTQLTSRIHAIDVRYIPDQFGGWSVDVTVNRNKGIEDGIENQHSDNYVEKVINALLDSINSTGYSISNYTSIAYNLANVVITGNDSISIKI